MPVPHLEIRIVQRSKGSSAVAGAAYQAGEKLFSEYDQKSKDHRRKQPEVLYTEIMFPANAPPEYADRATLWNAVEEVEKQWNSQLARRFILALPREVPTEMYPQMMQEYCREHFVSKGMCCDFAIHDPDPPGHNPHCHIMLTMRAIDENGKWLPKSRKVYDLDENGERIKLPSGNWKSHKEDTVDWNEQYHAEEWRHGWELVQNKYLELAGSPERVDMRSYERQGLDKIPTVHMGAAVCALERKGIETNIGNLNRDIKAANRMMSAIRSTIQNLRNWIADIVEATKEAFAETEAQAKNTSPDLVLLLRDYLNLRKAERSDWSRYGQQKGTTDDLKAVSKAIIYLKEHELFTLEDLDSTLQGMSEKAKGIHADMKKASARIVCNTSVFYLDTNDPKGTVLIECGKLLQRAGYRIKVLNTINFRKSMHYNPFVYIRSEKDVLKVVNTSRLQFSAEERATPELQKAIRKSDKAADRLDAARAAIPKHTKIKKERVFNEAKGRAKTRLSFEKTDKPPNGKLRHNPLSRPAQELNSTVHGKIYEVEKENVGVESGHRVELAGEKAGGMAARTVKRGIRSHKLKPYRAAAAAERKAVKANADFLYQKALHDNPALAHSNPISRFWQKQRIKKQYLPCLISYPISCKRRSSSSKSLTWGMRVSIAVFSLAL